MTKQNLQIGSKVLQVVSMLSFCHFYQSLPQILQAKLKEEVVIQSFLPISKIRNSNKSLKISTLQNF
ncbi:hypothetical protein QUB80_19260 [Chlorogloeopsis sp. ULAP01]|uniref:hypothetical protein n=1 Tax=Chlorogloeopsis sp. ULAP01 TaxID=3056483 RepID=UPI0025AAA553|nr:hypothetical protein [Chlorogloeopsis sp. ULAP01]MDM9382835.1 hypothetical protein [Chlorogloeopsis sp. ULAP01]